jgi:hypothetical protein
MGCYDTIKFECRFTPPPVLPKWYKIVDFQTKDLGKGLDNYIISDVFGNKNILYRVNKIGGYIPSTYTGNLRMLDYQSNYRGESATLRYESYVINGEVVSLDFIDLHVRKNGTF